MVSAVDSGGNTLHLGFKRLASYSSVCSLHSLRIQNNVSEKGNVRIVQKVIHTHFELDSWVVR